MSQCNCPKCMKCNCPNCIKCNCPDCIKYANSLPNHSMITTYPINYKTYRY